MSLSDICIRRPVFATVLSLIVLLVGAVSYTRLTVREYPRIDEPVVNVETRYPGASAEIMESQVTKPLEDSIAGIEGVDVITSISRSEQSQVTIRFKLTRDPDGAAADVRDRVARVRGRLPTDIDEPIISKVEADANPIIWLAFTSDRADQLEISDYANRIVKPRLQTLPGVADVRIFGERRYAMRIDLDRDRLASFRLSPSDVEDAIRRQNVEIPAGRIESQQREFNVVSQTDLQTPEQFGEVIVRNVGGANIRIRDVASVSVAPQNERTIVRFNGTPAVSLGIIKQAVANPLDIATALRKELPRIESDLPVGMQVRIANDQTVFIEQAINNVYKTIGEAVLLVAAVIFFFLRSWRAAIIPLVTIPVSLIGAFALMYAFGFSINTLTLLALVLAIGLVVDDAIVVLENVFRHIEEGMPRKEAAFLGMKEISFAVVAMTLTLAAVFAPVAFAPGRIGRLFIEFALTLAGSVLVSGFVALTLTPMMCSLMLRHQAGHGRVYNAIERVLSATSTGYRRALLWTLANRWIVAVLIVTTLAGSAWLAVSMKKELSPLEDRGTIVAIITGPEGASIDYTARYAQRIEGIAKNLPEVDRLFVVAGNPTVTQGITFMRLLPWGERSQHVTDIARKLTPAFTQIPGVQAFPVVPPSLGQGPREQPINFVVISSEPYEEIQKVVNAMMADIAKNPGLQAADTDLRLNRPELRVRIDRDKAADAGIQIESIGRALETMLGGRQVTRFKRNGEQYDVIVQVARDERSSPDDINTIFMRGRNDQMIPLSSLVRIDESLAPRELNHFGQRRAVTIRANLAPGYSLGEALQFLDQVADKHLKSGYTTDLNGQSREFRDSSSSLAVTFVLALAFIYLVLSAQFESFRDPFMIMLTVPLATAGALGTLMMAGGSLNVYSQIGLVTLVGLITKHGILIVEFANQLREQGRSTLDAVVEASELRLRPILMTTLAMVFGAVPLALATGAGAETRQQIGWVIVGGMSFGTLLTLFVIPTIYTFANRARVTPSQVVAANA
ncbi:MAG TPA: efflux RND transporter permease subunit [Burkholderiaceae bacterium]|nr:efflux RND transporter permease subunit [Burkholderiaceae bacterium]